MTLSILGGIRTPFLPLVITSSFGYPSPSCAQMVRRIDLRQNSVCQVADDYLFSSAALSMFRFDMTHDLRLEMFLKLWAYLKFQQKEGILSSRPYPPPLSSCHHMSSFG